MSASGDRQSFFLQDKDGLLQHYKRTKMNDADHLIKRLIDVQNFPDITSPELDAKLAYMRTIMLVKQGNYSELLRVGTETPARQVTSQVASMISAGEIGVQDIFKISRATTEPLMLNKPDAVVMNRIEDRG
ncbi:MAG TPA: hypothetical protein DCR64_06125 [Vibrio sp.]|nr:hypothetical protein [Vibrio sp.]